MFSQEAVGPRYAGPAHVWCIDGKVKRKALIEVQPSRHVRNSMWQLYKIKFGTAGIFSEVYGIFEYSSMFRESFA